MELLVPKTPPDPEPGRKPESPEEGLKPPPHPCAKGRHQESWGGGGSCLCCLVRLLCAKTHLQNNCPVASLVGDSFVKSWEEAAEVFSEIWLGVGELLKADFVLGDSECCFCLCQVLGCLEEVSSDSPLCPPRPFHG